LLIGQSRMRRRRRITLPRALAPTRSDPGLASRRAPHWERGGPSGWGRLMIGAVALVLGAGLAILAPVASSV